MGQFLDGWIRVSNLEKKHGVLVFWLGDPTSGAGQPPPPEGKLAQAKMACLDNGKLQGATMAFYGLQKVIGAEFFDIYGGKQRKQDGIFWPWEKDRGPTFLHRRYFSKNLFMGSNQCHAYPRALNPSPIYKQPTTTHNPQFGSNFWRFSTLPPFISNGWAKKRLLIFGGKGLQKKSNADTACRHVPQCNRIQYNTNQHNSTQCHAI